MTQRLTRSIKAAAVWCRAHRHDKVRDQHAMLCRKILGHYQYYGVTGNKRRLGCYLYAVRRAWRKWLDRRAQGRHMPWARYAMLLKRYPLPPPRIPHSYLRAANP